MWLINKVNSKNFVALRNLRFGAERALSREIGYGYQIQALHYKHRQLTLSDPEPYTFELEV